MTFQIILTVLFAVGALMGISSIDEPRKPINTAAAIIGLIINAVLIYGVWRWL